jgi:hypothetical protein
MPAENGLWASMPPETGGRLSWLLEAARLCQEHQCESCITVLVEAAQAEPKNYAIHYQMGICGSGGCRFHSQTLAEIALSHLRVALALVNPSEQPRERGRILSAMGNTWLVSSREPSKVRLQPAISCFKEAAQTYLRVGDAEAWARVEFNLGNSCCELQEPHAQP